MRQLRLPPLPELDRSAQAATAAALDQKTKPQGSLGRLEELACRVSAITGLSPPPRLSKAIVVLAGDHGVAAEGVSAFPSEVTGQMVRNFATGGAAINVLARQAGARLVVADFGVAGPCPPGVLDRKLDMTRTDAPSGTHNFVEAPAMSEQAAQELVMRGAELAWSLSDAGTTVLAIGEMGIGNTTSASALVAALTGTPVARVVGRGTGITDSRLEHKRQVVRRALERHSEQLGTPLGTLSALGGFEIAGMAGVMLGAASRRVPIVLDGFITGAAALVAARLAPTLPGFLLASHNSMECGHQAALKALDLRPFFDLDLRLGEASGAALLLPWLDAAVAIVHEMATFASAKVSERDGGSGGSPC